MGATGRMSDAGVLYRNLSWLAMGGVALLVVLTYRDYGIIWDEEWQNAYGVKLLAYYLTGFQDRSAFEYRDLYLYGGAFDMIAAAINTASPLGEYETRHLLGGLLGVAGMIGAWRLARLLAGERAAFIAVVLLALTPGLYGHMFNNPKDAPFAWGMIWTAYFLCRAIQELPRPRFATILGLGTVLGLTLATRVGGVLALIYLAATLAIYLGLRARDGLVWRDLVGEGRAMAVRFLPAMVMAFGIMAFFWPWSVHSPLNPLDALIYFNEVAWSGMVLVDGEMFPGTDLPPYYLPLLLAIKLPELVLIGLAAAGVSAAIALMGGTGANWTRARMLGCVVVILSAAFPIVYCVILRPLDFNGIRHFLFVVPPLVILAAMGLDALWIRLYAWGRAFGPAFGATLALAAGIQAWTMAELHPNEYVYYNELVGGVRGAAGKYELDYWGNSLAEASRKLDEHLTRENEGRPITRTYRALVCGYLLSALYFFPPYITYTTVDAEADFYVSFTHDNCDRKLDGRLIAEVERDGVVLSVVKDRRSIVAATQLSTTRR